MAGRPAFRGGGAHRQETLVVACRYWYELTDGYWGQLLLTQIPHASVASLRPRHVRYIDPMENFAGALEYLGGWRWVSPDVIMVGPRVHMLVSALPLLIDWKGEILAPGVYEEGALVFPTPRDAFNYLVEVAKADLLECYLRMAA